MSRKFVVLEGDQTGQELLEEALRVLDESVMGFPLNFIRYDLSLQNRRATNNEVVCEAGRALASTRSASKQPRRKRGCGQPQSHPVRRDGCGCGAIY